VDVALRDDTQRKAALEATLRVLDENPQYVDELFQLTLQHPRTLDRFLKNTAKGLEQDELARRTAARLVEEPGGLQRILIATLDEASDQPVALAAVSRAINERPQIAAMALLQVEPTVHATLRAIVGEVQKNAAARREFLVSLQENSSSLAALIVSDSKVLSSMMRAFAKAGLAKGKAQFDSFLEALEADAK
jgi:hypothetical protein